jgi:hypothetical protein
VGDPNSAPIYTKVKSGREKEKTSEPEWREISLKLWLEKAALSPII